MNTVYIPFIDNQLWNTHIMPHIHIIGLEQNTSRTFGIFGAIRPYTMHASTFPSTHINEGMMPYVLVISTPFINEPIPAHVAAMLIA